MLAGLAYILLPVTDLDRSVAFYRDVLGLSLLWHEREQGHAAVQVAEVVLVLSANQAPPSGHGAVVAFEVADIDEAYRVLSERGARFPSGIDEHRGRRTARFSDPDGNPLELNQTRTFPAGAPDG